MRGDDHSGSTAITALVTPTHVFVGNCGDSRAILVRGGNAVEMSIDHKPYLPAETARIEAAGGTVAMRRVNGDLAVSRALGDFVYKQGRDIRAEAQQVSAEPVRWPWRATGRASSSRASE
jgi:protein phosphatase 1B